MAYNGPQYNSNPRNNGNYNNRFTPRNGNSTSASTGGYKSAARNINNDSQTDGVLIYNQKMGKFMRTRFWNRTMGIDIGTMQPGAPMEYESIKNAQVFGTVFSFSVLFELHEICEEVLESLKQTNKFESTATMGNQKNDVIVEISNGNNINMTPGIYLVIYKNVDTGKRTNTMDFYPFSSTKVMRNYDHASGSSMDDIKLNGEFKKFTMMLGEACKAFTMAQAHAAKEALKLDKLGLIHSLSAISAKLGIDVAESVQQATASPRAGGNYQRNNANGATPNNYRRTSQPGQWNNNNGGGGYNRFTGAGNNQQNSFQKTQQAMAQIADEPVDVNLEAATLQQVSLADFA